MSNHEVRWRVYRATFDTNVFFRALTRPGNLASHLVALGLDKRFILVLSQAIIDEVQTVMSRREVVRKYPRVPGETTYLINGLKENAIIITEVPFSFALCRDVKDDKFVDCAILERVQFLVSYDNDLLDDSNLRKSLFEFGIEIADPPAFIMEIRNAEIVVDFTNRK